MFFLEAVTNILRMPRSGEKRVEKGRNRPEIGGDGVGFSRK